MFYNQPLSVRFGNELSRLIGAPWTSLDIAVAWVRASGMGHLSSHLQAFLRSGAELSTVVGIDLQSTTYEGLLALLELERHGAAETYVYHNEAGSTFHPKLYLFRNENDARLVVGSNNITESGLFTNVEAGLQIDASVDTPLIKDVRDALDSWKDEAAGLALRLDHDLLEKLRARGYIPDEKTASEIAAERRSSRSAKGAPLFKSVGYSAPLPPGGVSSRPTRPAGAPTGAPAPSSGRDVATGAGAAAPGTTLLMRLRKASESQRKTQTQIPIQVLKTFFGGSKAVQSTHTGQYHQTREARARGATNTIKLEIPEMRNFKEPLARFEQTPSGIVYEVYDATSPQGRQIKAALVVGRSDHSTKMTQPWNPDGSTWWRFI